MDGVPYSFRIVGDFWGRRWLVDASAALSGYAACDERAEVHREGYFSAFCYPEAFRQRADVYWQLEVAGYDGITGADWLHIDIDRPDLELALTEARRIASHILDRYPTLDDEDLLLFYSGSKGFHCDLPTSILDAQPSPTFHLACRSFAVNLAERAGVGVCDVKRGYRIDEGVYTRVQPFRAPNSKHPKTGLFKRRLTVDMLMHLTLQRIQELARTPEPFDLPEPPAIDDQAAADWAAAVQATQKQQLAKVEQRASGKPPTLNLLTREIIGNVADIEVGDRHRLFYSAARNCGEFSSLEELVHALLTEPGRDCGLTPKDIRRQIECGLKDARKQREVPGE